MKLVYGENVWKFGLIRCRCCRGPDMGNAQSLVFLVIDNPPFADKETEFRFYQKIGLAFCQSLIIFSLDSV